MDRKLKGFIRLIRVDEYMLFLLVFTAMGMLFAEIVSFEIVPLLLANILGWMFIFSFNDVEDADDDKKDRKKSLRNPISAGLLTRGEALAASFTLLALSLVFYISLNNLLVLAIALIYLALSFLYSWKPIRLKSKPPWDMIIHGAAFGFTTTLGYLLFRSFDPTAFLFFLMATLTSTIGEFINEIRDFNFDRDTGNRTFVGMIGVESANWLFLADVFVISSILVYLLYTTIELSYFIIWFLPAAIAFLKLIAPLIETAYRKGNMFKSYNTKFGYVLLSSFIPLFLSHFLGFI